MNKADKIYLSRLASLGCVVCRNLGYSATPPELTAIHHIRSGQGMKRAGHRETLPLCAGHHQIGGYGAAFHAGPAEWQKNYGTEHELLAQVQAEVAGVYGEMV